MGCGGKIVECVRTKECEDELSPECQVCMKHLYDKCKNEITMAKAFYEVAQVTDNFLTRMKEAVEELDELRKKQQSQ